jgi:chitin synthase
MGNRPTGSKKSYLLMVIFWSLLMCWLTFASIFLTVKSIQTEVSQKDFSFSTVFNNSTFFGLIVSLASTYVLWFVASFLFFDPWHMFTCFLQYIVLTPTYINVLNIYAFCNTHDITWGTKGDDKAEKLESVTVKADGKLDVAIPQDDGDLNAQYDAELTKFATKPVKEVKKVNAADKQEDYYKSFRSNVVTAWMITNFILAAAVLNTAGFDRINTNDTEQQNSTIYLAVILWSVAGLSLFRFIGACWFLVVRLVSFPP